MEKKNVNKKMIIIIAVAVVAVIVAIVSCFLIFGKKSYRILKVYKVEGDAKVVHTEGEEVQPYENMILDSGDRILLEEGTLVIKADEDKYIYLENHTEIVLVAEGTSENSKTYIELIKGAVINQIEEPLSGESVYELNTQNATMSVRGTSYRAAYTISENGIAYTDVQTFEGDVMTALVKADGSIIERNVNVIKGMQVQIYRDDSTTDYTGDPFKINFDKLSLQTLDYLKMIKSNSKKDLAIDDAQLEELIEEDPGPFNITFMNGDAVFGTTEVEKGDTVSEPLLMPTASGHWDFDFNTVIKEDKTINWVEGN